MTVQIELWALLTFLVGLLITFATCVLAFAKVLGGQIDKRLDEKFTAQEAARESGEKSLLDTLERYTAQAGKTAEQLAALEKDFLNWKAEMAVLYVRREDHIRNQSIIESKLDAVYGRLEKIQLKGNGHG